MKKGSSRCEVPRHHFSSYRYRKRSFGNTWPEIESWTSIVDDFARGEQPWRAHAHLCSLLHTNIVQLIVHQYWNTKSIEVRSRRCESDFNSLILFFVWFWHVGDDRGANENNFKDFKMGPEFVAERVDVSQFFFACGLIVAALQLRSVRGWSRCNLVWN